MNGFCTVILAKVCIQCPKGIVSLQVLSLSQALDSGFRRSDAVVNPYAIALLPVPLIVDNWNRKLYAWIS